MCKGFQNKNKAAIKTDDPEGEDDYSQIGAAGLEKELKAQKVIGKWEFKRNEQYI